MIFARKMPDFYIKIARIFFPNLGGGHVPPPAPVSYAYVGMSLNISETIREMIVGYLLLGAYIKVAGQNRLMASLMASRDRMTSQQ